MTDNKYKNGKIYKIICNETNDIYIGSTGEKYLSNRFANHRSALKKYNEGKTNYVSSFEIVKYESSRIVLIEIYSCNSKDELRAREEYWISHFKKEGCRIINKIGAVKNHNRKHEYYMENKAEILQKQKEYAENNKDKIYEKGVKYREEHQEEIKEKKKEYTENNKEKIADYHSNYYQQNKHKWDLVNKETMICDVCVKSITKVKFVRHCQSKYHQKFVRLNDQIKKTTEMYHFLK